jgi:hypothetical protein
MALKYSITAQEHGGLEEGIKSLYAEKDGGFVLSVEGVEDTTALKSALEKERASAKDYKKQVATWDALGKKPEEISEMIKQLETRKKDPPKPTPDDKGKEKDPPKDPKDSKDPNPFEDLAKRVEAQLAAQQAEMAALRKEQAEKNELEKKRERDARIYKEFEGYPEEQKAALVESMAVVRSWVGERLWVYEDVMEVGDIEHRVRELHRATGGRLRFIVVDYLQLVELRDARRGMNREQIVAEISRRLKRLGKKFNIACIVLAQFGRSPARESRRPMLSDLRESGSIENDADRVFALWLFPEDRSGVAQDEGNPVPLMQLIQLKNRNGLCGHEEVVFVKRLTRFDRAPSRGDGRPGALKPDSGYKRGGAS